VLSDEKGQTIAVTRIVPDTAYPRCELLTSVIVTEVHRLTSSI